MKNAENETAVWIEPVDAVIRVRCVDCGWRGFIPRTYTYFQFFPRRMIRCSRCQGKEEYATRQRKWAEAAEDARRWKQEHPNEGIIDVDVRLTAMERFTKSKKIRSGEPVLNDHQIRRPRSLA